MVCERETRAYCSDALNGRTMLYLAVFSSALKCVHCPIAGAWTGANDALVALATMETVLASPGRARVRHAAAERPVEV